VPRPRRPSSRLLYAASETEADALYPMDRARREVQVDRVKDSRCLARVPKQLEI